MGPGAENAGKRRDSLGVAPAGTSCYQLAPGSFRYRKTGASAMNTSDLVREKQINVRLNPEEVERLERVARHYGLSGPNTLRLLLKREDDTLPSVDRAREREEEQRAI